MEAGYIKMTAVTNRKILIIDDDEELSLTTAKYFIERGNEVECVGLLSDAEEALAHTGFDAVLLDLILPDGEGTDLFKRCQSLPPVIVMSALSSEEHMLDSFDAGALDYIIKPSSPRLIEARLSLRLLPDDKGRICICGLTADAISRTAEYNGKQLSLTGSEFNILWYLMNHAGVYFDAVTLYEEVWQMPSLKTNSIKYHISNLRRKIKAASDKDLIVTEFGKGYKFMTEAWR